MIPESQVTYEIKPMLYKICRVKNANYWITDYMNENEDIKSFSAYKSVPFSLSMSIDEFSNNHRLITHSTFIKYTKLKEEAEGKLPKITSETNE